HHAGGGQPDQRGPVLHELPGRGQPPWPVHGADPGGPGAASPRGRGAVRGHAGRQRLRRPELRGRLWRTGAVLDRQGVLILAALWTSVSLAAPPFQWDIPEVQQAVEVPEII